MRFGRWVTKRLGGCVPARSWRRKKKPTNNTPPHQSVEVRLTRRWIFVRPASSSPPSRPSSSSSASSARSTDPLTGPVVIESPPPPQPSSPRSCDFPPREVTKLRKSKSTASIPKQVIRKLSVTPPRASAPVVPAAASAEEEVEEENEREVDEREEGEEEEEKEEPINRRFFEVVGPGNYDRIRERVADHLPEATVVYEHGREKEGEEEEVERRVDEDPVLPAIVPQAAGESSFRLPRDTATSVIVQSGAVVIDKDREEKPLLERPEQREKEGSSTALLFGIHPSAPTSKKPEQKKQDKDANKTITQLPTPSASEHENDSDNDSGFTPTPPDVVDEAADLARCEEIAGWCLQQEDDQDLPGPGSLQISTFPYPRSTPVLSENHRLRQPKASILKPFAPPLINPDMSTLPDSTKAAGAQASAPGEKKLTGKELKEAKKAEKQARRAAEKLQRGDVPDAPAASGGTPTKQGQASASPGTSKPTQQGQKGKQQQAAPPTDGDAKTVAEPENKRIPFFEHLKENKPPIDLATINRDVHPSVVRLSMKLRNFEIIGSTARCLYMLLVFKEVINDYCTPEGVALARNLTQHLNLQISQIAVGRKLSVSQGNAIRWLKTIASRVPPEIPDEEAKRDLTASIDTYMKERIIVAQDVIANVAADKIANGDVILTYAKSTVVQRVLLRALNDGKQFSVIVIDSRPYFEGRGMARDLTRAGIQVKYTTLHALDHVMKTVNKVFLGAHAVYANGACYSRAGTSAVAMTAAEYQKPVMICCEGLKLSDKIVMDSITTNELGPTEALIGDDSPLQNHAEIPNLHIVNLLYDLTLPKYITAVITETGFTPPFGIPSVFRLLAEREGTVGAS
ncbi:uncharacterized protein DFL_004835 [Arthrobotrys flagrans]|uniref:Translation initiation factor eIF2B subunit delta n=1 Tax=Arthrobotrys flagrans TaxID=97331 RepID=A0A437A646_ARTFL|nr:hypothetical protein DFL_004835 [Arthrobotrys flagrans]